MEWFCLGRRETEIGLERTGTLKDVVLLCGNDLEPFHDARALPAGLVRLCAIPGGAAGRRVPQRLCRHDGWHRDRASCRTRTALRRAHRALRTPRRAARYLFRRCCALPPG